jgi:NADPH2:quinone reductase
MVKAVRVHTVGGRHRLQVEEVALPHPGCNEVEVRHRAIGLNYPDVEDCRGGGHHGPHSVFTPGSSAVGVITELGMCNQPSIHFVCLRKLAQMVA